MITHIPGGLVPHVPCGYARVPEVPLVGQTVTVGCRVDGDGVAPVLRWSVNGGERPGLVGRPSGEDCYTYELGAFNRPCRVRYSFCAVGEPERGQVFDVCEERAFGGPKELITRDGCVLAVFEDDFAVEFSAGDGFTLRYLRAFDQSGERVEAASLPCGVFSLELGRCDSLWQLKRFSQVLARSASLCAVRDSEGRIVTLRTSFTQAGKHLFGLGERFDAVDQMGCERQIKVVEKFTRQEDQSYLPVPFVFNEQGFGWFRSGAMPIRARMGETVELEQSVLGDIMIEDRLLLGAPQEQFGALTRQTGAPAMPPDWAFGVWMSANGWDCDAEVDAVLAAIREQDYPASVLVLEAWSDEQTFHTWNDAAHWQNPAATVKKIRDAGLHLVLWQIPVIKSQKDPGAALAADEREAIQKGYVVRGGDGEPYRIPDLWFKGSLLPDFTSPDARAWWFAKRKYLLDMGVEGFKTDGGEFLYDQDATLSDGTPGAAGRNLYANCYVAAYHGFMQEQGVHPLTFSRAGWSGAQAFPMHWAGDQLSQWSELSAQLTAGLSAGLSGIPFWGFDIGGFAGGLPSKELYLRATAMACFCPVMQWHAEPRSGQFYATHEDGFVNDRSPWNLAQKLGDPEVMELARKFAKLRYELMPYILREATACVEQPRPMMAHLAFDFAEDAVCWKIHDEYMFGRSMLVAPVVEEGAEGRDVYLPRGRWRDHFTGEHYEGPTTVSIVCPLDRIPVFVKE